MSDYVYESGMSTKRRRQRRTAITLVLTLLLLFGAFWWAWSYIRDEIDADATPTPTDTEVPEGCIDPKDVTINVYNATNRAGLARTSADALQAAGFTIGDVANDPEDKDIEDFAELRFGPAAEVPATAFLDHYGQPVTLTPVERDGTSLDVVLGDAFDGFAEFPEDPACADDE